MQRKMTFLLLLLMVGFGPVLAQDMPHDILYAVVGSTIEIRSVNADTGDITQLASLPATGSDAGWSPDGHYLYLITPQPNHKFTLNLTDTASGSTQHITDRLLMEPYDCTGQVWWSPDGRYMAYLDNDPGYPAMHIDDTRAGRLLDLPPGTNDMPASAPWSPDSRYFAYAAAGDVLEIWDMTTGSSISTHPRTYSMYGAEWLTPELLGFSTNRAVGVYNVTQGREQRYDGDSFLTGSPDGRYLYIQVRQSESSIVPVILDTVTGITVAELDENTYPMRRDWSPDSRYRIGGAKDTRLMDMTDGSERVLAWVPHEWSSLAWNPFGHIVTFSRTDYTDNASGTWIYNLDAGTFKRINPNLFAQYGEPEVLWSPDGKYLHLRAKDGLKVFDNAAQTLHDFGFMARWVRPSPDSTYYGFINESDGQKVQVISLPDFNVRSLTGALVPDKGTHVQLIGWRGDARMNPLLFQGNVCYE